MKIEYNECYEFITAVHRFANRLNIVQNQKDNNLKGMESIREWVGELEKKLSPFFLNDIEFMLTQLPVNLWVGMQIIRTPDVCGSMDQFFNRFDALTSEEYRSLLRYVFCLDKEEEATPEKIKVSLLETTTMEIPDPDKLIGLVLSMMAKPKEFLDRLKTIIHEFYNLAYEEYRKKYRAEVESLYDWHREKLAEDPLLYLNGVTTGLFKHLFQDRKDISVYYSFFGETETHITTSNAMMIVGGATKEKFHHHTDKERAGIFLNLMGDRKRLEIMRLLAKRPWYSMELAREFKITPATMSYHLNKLVSSGLAAVKTGEQNRFYYVVNREQVANDLKACERDLLQ